jgi:hypothetical protein
MKIFYFVNISHFFKKLAHNVPAVSKGCCLRSNQKACAALRGFASPYKGFAQHRTEGTRPGPTKCGGGLEAVYTAIRE